MEMTDDLSESKWHTKDYKVTKVIAPGDENVHESVRDSWAFYIEGPGWDARRVYVAQTQSCGPHLIKSLQAAYSAGAHSMQSVKWLIEEFEKMSVGEAIANLIRLKDDVISACAPASDED